ncbi:hypothetical protein BCR42DRAFT_423580, partial [Absidia repens]
TTVGSQGAVHPFFSSQSLPTQTQTLPSKPTLQKPLPPNGYIINTILNFALQYTPPQ